MLLLFAASLLCTKLIGSFVSELSNVKILSYAELCNEVYSLKGMSDEMTQTLRTKDFISPNDKVILQGFRNGGQLSSVVIKTGINSFRMVFSGTESFADAVLDILALPVETERNIAISNCILEAHPSAVHIRIKKKHRIDQNIETHSQVEVSLGFEIAGRDFMSKVFEGLKPYIVEGHDIYFDISGHSLGGALASQMAYHIKTSLADIYQIPSSSIGIRVVTFAAAGYFREENLEEASKVCDASNTMVHFYRRNDMARDLTDLAGYKNPGKWIVIDNFVHVEGSLAEYLKKILAFQVGLGDIRERIADELQNHSIRNYLKTILKAIEESREIIATDEEQLVISDDTSGALVPYNWSQLHPFLAWFIMAMADFINYYTTNW